MVVSGQVNRKEATSKVKWPVSVLSTSAVALAYATKVKKAVILTMNKSGNSQHPRYSMTTLTSKPSTNVTVSSTPFLPQTDLMQYQTSIVSSKTVSHKSSSIDSVPLEQFIMFIIECNYKSLVNMLEDKASMLKNNFIHWLIEIILHHEFLIFLTQLMRKFFITVFTFIQWNAQSFTIQFPTLC